MQIQSVAYGTEHYEQIKHLRQAVLRTPIGLMLSAKDVEGEDSQLLIAAIDNGKVAGSVILKPLNATLIKLRQMAVADAYQGQGLGKKLVLFGEALAKEQHFAIIECHARVTAQVFYEKLGYHTEGNRFSEVGLDTIKMLKTLK